MSACRKSCAIVSPAVAARCGAVRHGSRSMRARRAASASSSSPLPRPSRASPTSASRALAERRNGRDPHVFVLPAVARRAEQQPRRRWPRAQGRGSRRAACARRGRSMPSSAASRPTASGLAASIDHFSSVRCASMPAKPPAATMPIRRPIASKRGSPEPSAHAACSRMEAALVREQSGQHPRRLLVEDLGQRVHGGDRRDLVVAVSAVASTEGCAPPGRGRPRTRGRRRAGWRRRFPARRAPRPWPSGCPCRLSFARGSERRGIRS